MSTSEREPAGGRLGQGDALYLQLQGLLQQGRWQEARTVLDVLARRHAGSKELARYQELLEMRLSAEETWGAADRGRAGAPPGRTWRVLAYALRRPAIRGLLAANVIIYLLLVLVWLLADSLHG